MRKSARIYLSLTCCVAALIVGCSELMPIYASDLPLTNSNFEEDEPKIVEIWFLAKPDLMRGETWDPRVIDKFGRGLFSIQKPHELVIHLPNEKKITLGSLTSSLSIIDEVVQNIGISPPNGFGLDFEEALFLARSILTKFNVPPTSHMHRRLKVFETQVHAGKKLLPFYFHSGVDLELYPDLVLFIRLSDSVDGSWYITYSLSIKLKEDEEKAS